MMRHTEFYAAVERYITDHPEAAAHISDHVQAGLIAALDETRTRASDMEIALAVTLSGKRGPIKSLTIDKLRKWKGKSSLEWGWLLEEVEEQRT